MTSNQRTEERSSVEILAHFRKDISSVTVVLRDLSSRGARVEGVAGLKRDEAVSIGLPSTKPRMAFVAWASEQSAGLEFAEPLPLACLSEMVRNFGVGQLRSAA